MSFNLKDANAVPVQTTPTFTYQKPGIYDNIKVTKVNLGSYGTGSKYLQLETVSPEGNIGKSPQMSLKSELGEGKTISGWMITARNLKNYIKNTHNISEEEADATIEGVKTEEELSKKVSALLVGKSFRAKFSGVETSKGYIIAELSGSESLKISSEDSKLKYSVEKDTKKYQGTMQTPTSSPMTSANAGDDLPF